MMIEKIGIILDTHPHDGGAFQYSLNLLDAVYRSTIKRGMKLTAFAKSDVWQTYLSKYHTEQVELTGNYIGDAAIIDQADCDLAFSASQDDWGRRLSTPVVIPIHDLMHRYETGFPESCDEGERLKRDIRFHSNLWRAAGVLVDSETGKQQVMESYGACHKDKIYVLPFAAPQYLCEEEERVDIPFDKYIFYPAQFWKHKNHVNLLFAVAALREKKIKVNCVFAGTRKNGYDDAMKTIKENHLEEQVAILGYVSNTQMKYLYRHARAMIMPTFFGPTNIPPVEAITLGCPVAVSNVYAMPEQLGDAAVYFDPNSVDEIACAIRDYWEDDALCEKMRERGYQRSARFSQETFNDNFDRIFGFVISQIETRADDLKQIEEFCDRHKAIYICGAGKYAYQTYRILKQRGRNVCTFLVSDPDANRAFGDAVHERIERIRDGSWEESSGFICGVSEETQGEMKECLRERSIREEDIYCIDSAIVEKLYDAIC